MGGELKKFKADFDKLKDAAAEMWAEVVAAAATETTIKGVCEGLIDAIGARVEVLKEGGRSGDSVDDFDDDKDVKLLHDELNENVETLRKNADRANDAQALAKPIYDDLLDLKARIEKEAKSRKTKIVGKESKSAPEMEKLAKEIGDYVNETQPKLQATLRGFQQQKPRAFAFDKAAETRLDKSIAKSKTDRAEAMAKEMLEQQLNMRLLKGKSLTVNRLSGEITEALKDALKAMKENSVGDSKVAMDSAIKGVKDIKAILEPVTKAYEEFVQGTDKEKGKDAQVIFAMITKMTALHVKAETEVDKIQTLLKGLATSTSTSTSTTTTTNTT